MFSGKDDFSELERKYEKILENDPSSNIFVLYAEILIKQNKLKKAIEVLNKGLKHNGSNITARFLLAKIYFDNWMIDQSKKHFEYILTISPDNLASVKYLVQIYRSENNYEKAITISRNALFYFPDNKDIHEMLDTLQNEYRENFESGGCEEEISHKQRNSLTERHVISETLADLYMKQGYYSESIEIYEKLMEHNNDRRIDEKKQRAIRMLFSSRSGK